MTATPPTDDDSDELDELQPTVLPTPPVIELELLEEFELKDRSKRGIQNNITGGLLCPVEFDWDNSTIRTAIWNFENDFDFASSARACCFYTDSTFNPNDLDEGRAF
ncbi:hypothetical protein BDP27DRAFT_1495310 [Rhodocollybia butyracea]|uniref:Uncharacterized protein n=1 Tax=Rhodocollybia butyracea TaxID=206335 RepID=A0A9P5TZ87_9AGAR|nr:hypothetical protein BDP27DRAFT_1495310 [Rhodocollybia butyracea]